MDITKSTQWRALVSHLKNDFGMLKINDLFEQDADKTNSRFDDLSFKFDQLIIDFSKQKVDSTTLTLLTALATEAGLDHSINELVTGQCVNSTENRPALHTALRGVADDAVQLDGTRVYLMVQEQLAKMSQIIDDITSGNWRGYSGKPITDVVNLGVGGSDLGPLLVCHALDEFKIQYKREINVHFASTMDGSQVSQLFEQLNPETTIFIIVSKSFSTIDTLSNAASAKAWLSSYCSNEKIVNKQHFIGISTNTQRMNEWGILADHQLKLWDWVGGRFSLWSTVGLTIALKIGMANFRELLSGANKMDKHFSTAPWNKNLPVLMGLIGVWNTNFLGISAQAILPYDARLKYFPGYLTQLEMESNGKSVTHSGEKIPYDSCPILWGEVGPNAQHAFYQLLHQGTRKVACDFIAPVNRFTELEAGHEKSLQEQHLLTLANCFAQSSALMKGGSLNTENQSSSENASEHKYYPGDQPSTTILIDQLSPYSLGQLIALYEHKVFVMATIWGINPFDQWGVELGKIMANETLSKLKRSPSEEKQSEKDNFDVSTNGLIDYVKLAQTNNPERNS